jgi:hypothetical protein
MEKLLLIILFIAISYYPLCGIIGIIRYIRGESLTLDEVIKHAEDIADTCEYETSKYNMSDPYESHVACQEGECSEEHRQLAEWLKELKQLREQTRWIPVSKRLPKALEFVNCTCHSLIDDREDWVIETVYVPQPSDSPYSDWGNIPMLNSGDCEVVAWMHRDIPKPYRTDHKEK